MVARRPSHYTPLLGEKKEEEEGRRKSLYHRHCPLFRGESCLAQLIGDHWPAPLLGALGSGACPSPGSVTCGIEQAE